MPPLPALLQVAVAAPTVPNYAPQLEAIVRALNHHEAIPSWLLGALLGFTLGLLAEPLKSWIQKFLVRRRTEKLLMAEVEMNCLMADLFVAAPGLPKITFTTEKYDYFRDEERLAVFEIDKAGSLSRLYRSFKEIADGPAAERTKLITYEFSLFEDAVKQGAMGPYFKLALDKERSALRNIAAKYVPPSQQKAPAV